MAVVAERYDSRASMDGKDPWANLNYWVMGTTNEEVAKSSVRGVAPSYYTAADQDGNAKTLVQQTFAVTRQGPAFFYVDVRYGPQDPDESSWQFDTSGGTHHITQSLATVGAYGNGAAVTDYKGAINVTGAGKNVEGVEIIIPRFEWSERHVVAASIVTQAYAITLADLTGCVNNAAFRGFAAGEVLFRGAQGSKTGQDDWDITYNFSRSPNVSSLDVGGITVSSKKGHEYLWVLYKGDDNQNINELARVPKAVYVERVYEEANLDNLGISYLF